MKRFLLAMLLLVASTPAAAGVVAATSRGVVVAHDGVIELFEANSSRIWSAPGLEHATKLVAGENRVAVLDAWANRVRIAALADGSGVTIRTGETPIDGVFIDDALYLLARDASAVERIAADGTSTSIAVAADPAFLRRSGDLLYVYSRVDGLLQEIDPRGKVVRLAPIGSFAADMEIDGRTAYLVFPREAKLVTVDLDKLEIRSSVAAGGAPTDLAVSRRDSALSAPLLAVADPAAKRLWITEGRQSVGAAFGRGFLRGLLGLGLFRPRSSEFPTGIDRVMSAGGVTLAFDSATGTLYRVRGSKSSPVAQDVVPNGFTVAGEQVAYWSGDALHFQR